MRPRVKATIKITITRKFTPVIDPALVGRWSLVITDAGSFDTFNADGTWTRLVILRPPTFFIPNQTYVKGYYQAKNGQITDMDAISRSRETDSDPWSAWKPAPDLNKVQNYVVGTDEYGEYLSTEDAPNPVIPASAKYRRSGG